MLRYTENLWIMQNVVSWLENHSSLAFSIKRSRGLWLQDVIGFVKQWRQKWKLGKNYLYERYFDITYIILWVFFLHLNQLVRTVLDLQKNWKDSAVSIHILYINFIFRDKWIYYSIAGSMDICIFVSYIFTRRLSYSEIF